MTSMGNNKKIPVLGHCALELLAQKWDKPYTGGHISLSLVFLEAEPLTTYRWLSVCLPVCLPARTKFLNVDLWATSRETRQPIFGMHFGLSCLIKNENACKQWKCMQTVKNTCAIYTTLWLNVIINFLLHSELDVLCRLALLQLSHKNSSHFHLQL